MQVESPLIVLSSCNTGAGTFQPGEGVLSLARAFHFAGAQSLIMSQWPVDDAVSVIVMDNFYKGIKNGLSLTKSLQQAKCFYIETAGKVNANPSYWASFQLTGYSDKIIIKETRGNKKPFILGFGIVIIVIILLTVRLNIKKKNQ
jgi:CHAT domain-containing protein